MIGISYIKTVVNGIKTWATHLFARKDEVLTNIELTPEQIAELKGDKGDKGDTGAAGHTPVRGTDYWTSEDQQAIVNDVLAALPTWGGGSY